MFKRYYEEIFELLMAVLSPPKSISFSLHTTGNSTHEQPYSVLTLIALRTFLNNLLQRCFRSLNMVSYALKNYRSKILHLILAVRALETNFAVLYAGFGLVFSIFLLLCMGLFLF